MMRINGGGLAATIVLLLLCLLWWAGYTFVQHKLVADEEASKAKHIVSLLAMHKQGPGLTSFLEKLRRNRERRSSISPQWG